MNKWLNVSPGKLLDRFVDAVYPRFCSVCCAQAGPDYNHVCWDCRTGFTPIVDPFCSICGNPADGDVDVPYTCSWCRTGNIQFSSARSAFRLMEPLTLLLKEFKYGSKSYISSDFAAVLEALINVHYQDMSFDGIVPVPLHRKREKLRTYNQSELIARGISGDMGIPVYGTCVERVNDTPSQTGFNRKERKGNIRGAFRVTHPDWVDGRTFLVVDDVITSGATTNELSRVLKESGAAEVHVVSVARG